jgi:two-component sensor histidine kinase
VRLRALPLLPGGRRVGVLVLLRDVTEVRRRDRELLTKDATIREIHHRVKNNLQTVAALLRLQARRTPVPAARSALEESVRRVTAIAVVHETLSRSLAEAVDFDPVADTIAALSVDLATTSTAARAVPTRVGSFGVLPSQVATLLALVLSELVSNAVEHGYDGGSGAVAVRVARSAAGLEMVVADDGAGLRERFALPDAGGLGLQIVRTLVVGELRGTFALRPGPLRGTEAVIAVAGAVLAGS